jgi:hypothetical protein
LSRGLRDVAEIPESEVCWLEQARGTMHEAIAAPRERLRLELTTKSIRSRARAAAWGLGVSAIGGAAGAAAGGGLLSAAAASIASTGATVASEYLRDLSMRREKRALLSHYMLFDPNNQA